jgi:penicillin-insensitive murein DD-endopeptidase
LEIGRSACFSVLYPRLDFWFKESTLHSPPRKPKPPLTLAGLPSECKQIVRAP